ncbi:DUF3995 domain-containing protein [Salinactinospora qingdaonensis]|uniref:DUF3995 domain-containing protein n=1 Tax=Salinactinospora qingdaonensis TaxID=702744 RepID=A0ABP7FGC0_9ACTN
MSIPDSAPHEPPGAGSRPSRSTQVAAGVAMVLALAYALLKGYWALGGMALRNTVSVAATSAIMENPWFLILSLWGTVVLALIAIAIPALLLRRGGTVVPRRMVLVPAWIGVAFLLARGVVGVIDSASLLWGEVTAMAGFSAAEVARFAWWDLLLYSPGFALWGLALGVVAWRTRAAPAPRSFT